MLGSSRVEYNEDIMMHKVDTPRGTTERDLLLLGKVTDEDFMLWICPHHLVNNRYGILFVYYLLDKEPGVEVLDVNIPVFHPEEWCLKTNLGKVCHNMVEINANPMLRLHEVWIK